MTWLIYIFAAYLLACYLWAMYLIVRLYTGKRLRVLLRGRRDDTASVISTAPAPHEPLGQPAFTHAEPAPRQHKAAA